MFGGRGLAARGKILRFEGKMSVTAVLRINMTGLDPDPEAESERYRAAVEMAAYADEQGFDVVNLEEHHCAENGWLPSPLTLAAMVLARTQRIRVNVAALLIPLYDPIRLAEDVAVLDLVARGRFSFVAGMGYRPEEYHATGRDWEARGRLMDEALETLLRAWSGEPFDYKGRTIRVTPPPRTRPHPFFFVGGMSPAAARRAARFGLPFYPPMPRPDLANLYHEELARQGKTGFYYAPGEGNAMTVVDPEPERAWEELAPYFLRELQEYSRWKVSGVPRPSEEEVRTVEELRAQGRFEIVTPDDCLRGLREASTATVVQHPLAGGIPLPRAWSRLELFNESVLRPLRGG